MNLLYVWNRLYSGPEKNDGYVLSSRYEISFDESGEKLAIKRRKSLSANDFWGENIYDVMAVVGSNGAGKTRLAYCIMDTLNCAEQLNMAYNQNGGASFLLIFEDDGKVGEKEPTLKIIAVNIPKLEIEPDVKCLKYGMKYEQWNPRQELKRFKFAYFTDALSLTDYEQKKYGIVYDGSLGGSIRRCFESNYEMRYIDIGTNPITNYFDDEMDRILKFVCFERDTEGIPFPLPKRVTFSPKFYDINLNYISGELKRMHLPEGKDILEVMCKKLEQQDRRQVRSRLAINVMLNLFKEYCIPQTSSDHLEGIARTFLNKVNEIAETGYFGTNPFGPVLELMEAVKPEIGYGEFLEHCQNMLVWINTNHTFGEREGRDGWTLDLEKDVEIVKQLYDHYRKTRFPFPYFSIFFGLSTGEYAFLRRFSKINELLIKRTNGCAYVENNEGYTLQCDGLMLYLDEADQSLHPEWQRQQIDWLLRFISARFKTCKVHLIVSTHSPIMLSDIPRGHVLYLSNKEHMTQNERRDIRTFGSNVHTLFRDAFFLSDGTMGAFAERKINEIAQSLQDFGEEIPSNILSIVEEIGDDVIRNKLRQMCRVRPSFKERQMDRQAAEQTIHLLRNQVKHLETAIRELENIGYDQD